MATCRDCFHWEACKAMFEASGGIIVADDFKGSSVRCKSFVSTADVAPRAEVAREIFEEIDRIIFGMVIPDECAIISIAKLAELKKKYTDAEAEPPKGD